MCPRQRLDSDLTFDEAGAASPLSDESARHKRQSFWDWNNGAGDAAADDYTYEDNGDYNGTITMGETITVVVRGMGA